MDEIRFENGSTFSIDETVCHGFHNPFRNKMASANALISTRFVRARSRVKPTTETKNSASKVMRVTRKSPIEAEPAQGLMEPEETYKLGFAVRWATPGRLIARAFFGRRDLRASLGGEVGAFSRRQGRTSANRGEYPFLKPTSTPTRPSHESNSSSKSNEWLRFNLFRAAGNQEFESRARTDLDLRNPRNLIQQRRDVCPLKVEFHLPHGRLVRAEFGLNIVIELTLGDGPGFGKRGVALYIKSAFAKLCCACARFPLARSRAARKGLGSISNSTWPLRTTEPSLQLGMVM